MTNPNALQEQTQIIDPEVVYIKDGELRISSLTIASELGRLHKNVLNTIRKVGDGLLEIGRLKDKPTVSAGKYSCVGIYDSIYVDSDGRKQPCFELTFRAFNSLTSYMQRKDAFHLQQRLGDLFIKALEKSTQPAKPAIAPTQILLNREDVLINQKLWEIKVLVHRAEAALDKHIMPITSVPNVLFSKFWDLLNRTVFGMSKKQFNATHFGGKRSEIPYMYATLRYLTLFAVSIKFCIPKIQKGKKIRDYKTEFAAYVESNRPDCDVFRFVLAKNQLSII